MRTHNLATVVAFEVRRTLAKPTFWIASLSVPLLMAFIFGLSFFSGMTAAQTSLESEAKPVTFTYTDASGLVVPEVAATLGGTLAPDAAAAAQAVRDGKADLFLEIPADPVTDGVHIVGRDLGLTDSGRWPAVAQNLLRASAEHRIGDPALTGVLQGVPVNASLEDKPGSRPCLAVLPRLGERR